MRTHESLSECCTTFLIWFTKNSVLPEPGPASTLKFSSILIISLVVGLIISIFQATTQIQEQTLTFVPKLIAIILVLVLGGPWMLNKLVMLTNELFQSISTIVN